eukprot:CAMPEP_0176504220 /NCGR_PEP_ID=MMETSP0200_2-20121128/15805_1 /TAXON_ID=947934 /ORGANISM="Chaetoceros sp., Strain GSL56" /LENGTH=888 /DNA_ID=CAMNT_0017903613 /DNA_START=3159 /DNA_END=5822 /DNA_ORIENTATION=+
MVHHTSNEKRAFQSEAESTIRKAIELNKETDNSDDCDQIISARNAGRAVMAARASIVSKSLPVIEESTSVKTFGFMSDSSMSITSPPPKLRDIARRIKMIQKVSEGRTSINQERRSLMITGTLSPKQVNATNGHMRPSFFKLWPTNKKHSAESGVGSPDTSLIADDLDIIAESFLPQKTNSFCNNFRYSLLKIVHFLEGRKRAFVYTIKVFFYCFMPLSAIASAIFYILGNPLGLLGASYSWWILYVIRHIMTFMIGQAAQFLLIDVFVLETKLALMIFGRVVTLIAMQAKGWPILMLFWSLCNYVFLYGDQRYVQHWIYWQEMFRIFNEENPSGTVTSNHWYGSILLAICVCSLLAMVKRVLVAVFLGRKKYATYGRKMEQIMMKVLLISEIALLAEEIEDAAANNDFPVRFGGLGAQGGSGLLFSRMQSSLKIQSTADENKSDLCHNVKFYDVQNNTTDTSDSGRRSNGWKATFKKIGSKRKNQRSNLVDASTKAEIEKLLEWEEPMTKQTLAWNDTTIRTILQFKETLNYMDTDHPLSVPFGKADTQKHCIESSEKVFNRLLMKTPEVNKLKFETLLIVALNEDGTLDRGKVKLLKKLFKPSRHGYITVYDFIRACHDVYKRIKMFRAKTLNSAQLDDAFEQLINIVFYFALTLVALTILGVDPFSVFISLTGILVPLAFLFNEAGSEYFQGLLLILVRQPYDIGDCISVSDPISDAKINGSQPWFVEGITLFTTTIRSGPSNEISTVSNGALAKTRIMNGSRSPKAQVFVFLKFSIDVPYEKVKIFQTVVKEFIKDRPKEWIQMTAFRAIRVEVDQGFIEYELIAQHVEQWQIVGQVLQSRSDLSSFCLEVMKQMDMRYMSPSMPVNVTLQHDNCESGTSHSKS